MLISRFVQWTAFVATLAIAPIVLSIEPAQADDLSAIQALITLDANEYDMTNHGVFHTIAIVEDKPCAFATVLFGASGFAGTEYLLEQSSAGWAIVAGPAKDMFTVGMLTRFVSEGEANRLEGANCPPDWFFGRKLRWVSNHGLHRGKAF